jgi:hypothetical protein
MEPWSMQNGLALVSIISSHFGAKVSRREVGVLAANLVLPQCSYSLHCAATRRGRLPEVVSLFSLKQKITREWMNRRKRHHESSLWQRKGSLRIF